MIRQLPVQEDNIVAFRLTGKLHHADYQTFVPQLEALIKESGQISVLLELEDFHGWDPQAAWDDLRLGMQHQDAFERIAVVGHGWLQHWMAVLAKPFSSGEVRFFEHDELGNAWDWLRETHLQVTVNQTKPAPISASWWA